MKKLLYVCLLFFILPVEGFSQFTHIGPGAAFSTEIREPGFGLFGIYRVNDQIKLTPNVLYYIPHNLNTADGTQKFQWITVNMDGNYVFLNQEIIEVFGIMGLNFSYITGEQDELILGQEFKDKNSLLKLGLNIGAGVRFNISDKVAPFGEIRYTLGSKVNFTFNELSTSQFGIFAGVLIRINEDKDRSAKEDF
jgi:hypothetical protein